MAEKVGEYIATSTIKHAPFITDRNRHAYSEKVTSTMGDADAEIEGLFNKLQVAVANLIRDKGTAMTIRLEIKEKRP